MAVRTFAGLTICIALFIVLSGLMRCKQGAGDTLTIAAAANTRYATEALIESFTETTGIPCQLTVSSSGKLTAQIVAGAPYDVFLSADLAYPQELHTQSLTTGPPQVFGYGKLVLWVRDTNLSPSIAELTSPAISRIALANPRTAPYGRVALQCLSFYQLYDSVERKCVFGESISQVNQFLISGAVDIAFTAQSVVLSEAGQTGHWALVTDSCYTPIAQGVVILERSGQTHPHAEAFHDFLFTSAGRSILDKFGYTSDVQ